MLSTEMNRSEAVAATLTLLRLFRDTRPRWTHDLPTRAGYYWMREGKSGETLVVHVRIDYSEAETPFVVQVGHPADTGVQFLRDYHGCQWCGPLETPAND